MIKVFFDASVLFSGFYSGTGASRKLLELIKEGIIVGITTQTVVDELEENIEKFKTAKKPEIKKIISLYKLLVRERIRSEEINHYRNLVDPKDAHVITGTILTECNFLVTLDKKHLDNPKVKEKIHQIKIVSPKELLNYLSRSH